MRIHAAAPCHLPEVVAAEASGRKPYCWTDHPFVTHAAWDFVIVDECLSVQNVDAKR